MKIKFFMVIVLTSYFFLMNTNLLMAENPAIITESKEITAGELIYNAGQQQLAGQIISISTLIISTAITFLNPAHVFVGMVVIGVGTIFSSILFIQSANNLKKAGIKLYNENLIDN